LTAWSSSLSSDYLLALKSRIDVLKSTVDEIMDLVMEEAARHTADKLVNNATNEVKDLVDADVMLDAIRHTFGFSATSPIGLLDNLPPQDDAAITFPIKLPKETVGLEIQPHQALIESPPVSPNRIADSPHPT
jgi:hypothetical protein